MCTYLKKIILPLVLVFVSSCVSKRDQTWNALVLGLPEQLGVGAANVNMGLYVIKQTHEPIFRIDKYGQFYSQILKNWERNRDYSRLTFCPNEQLSFDSSTSFDSQYLKSFIDDYSSKMNLSVDSKIVENCLVSNIASDGKRFLTGLTKYENSPTHKVENKNYEYGLGKFEVSEFNKKELIMLRKEKNSNGFNKIVFKTYEGPEDLALKDKNFEDFNRVFVTDIPDWVQKEFKSFDVQLLQSVNLVLNIQDEKARKRLFHCIDVDKFRRAFAFGQTKFSEINNILPVGVLGGVSKRVEQNCSIPDESISYPFYNWKVYNFDSLKEYFDQLKKQNIHLSLENHSLDDFVSSVFKQPHPYKITVMAFDATIGSHEPFFTHLVNTNQAVIDSPLTEASPLLENLLKETNETKKEILVEQILTILKKSYYILPMYQEQRSFYYPKRIKDINLGNNFLEFPEIGELKIE